MSDKFVACLTTVASRTHAEAIAKNLVVRRVAACVNVLPGAVSFYHWKRKLRRDREVLLVIKTTASKVTSLEKELLKIHPYECPEFIVLPIAGGSRRYLAWIKDSVKGS